MHYNARHGFSLVELSIVLVILGLLTGGILAGKSLIRAAELRSVTTEYNRFITASRTFQDKYFGLPGDITNATSIWGAATNCFAGSGVAVATCNGNGNGLIQHAYGGAAYNEEFMHWQHLTNAGLIEGSYAGYFDTTVYTTKNSPATKAGGNGFWIVEYWATSSGGWMFDGAYNRNFYELGNWSSSGGLNTYGVLTAEEAWNMDTKIDDGKPASGLMMGAPWNVCTLASTRTDLTADYKTNLATAVCILLLKFR